MIKIKNKKDCCGCSACVSICPKHCFTWSEDEEGFLYPLVDENLCIDCDLCNKVCPEINQAEARKPLKIFAAKNKDENIRLLSSSGGIFSLLANNVIEKGGVVFGVRFNETWEVIHDFAETAEGLENFRGSKYVQSILGDTFMQVKRFLKTNRLVLFSGTPCQVAGLKLFLNKDYENLITVDFVCHGVPSPLVYKEYLRQLSDSQYFSGGGAISFINFRDKSIGWKEFSLSIKIIKNMISSNISKIEFRNKNRSWKNYDVVISGTTNPDEHIIVESVNKNSYMKGFISDLYLRPSCHDCPAKSFTSGADITLSDFWGVWNVAPEFDDDKGVSCVAINTNKGEFLYQDIIPAITAFEVTYKQAFVDYNYAATKSASITKKRDVFFRNFQKVPFDDLIKSLTKQSVKHVFLNIIRFIISKIGLLSKLRKLLK